MSVKMEKLSDCRVKLFFTTKAEDFAIALDKAFEKKVKEVDIKGFRKGKIPRSMYNSKFGEESLYDEAVNIIVNEEYSKYLEKSKLNIIDSPHLDVDFASIGRGKKLSFTLEVDIWPEVVLGQYRDIEVEKEKINVSEEDIEQYIERILKQHASLEILEDASLENGYTAVFDFEGFVDEVAFEGGKSENYSLEIGSGQFIPGFEEQMLGMKTGEERNINVTFPEEYHADGLAGKAAVFHVKLHEIKRRIVPTLNDEFVVDELDLESIKTVDEYKAYVNKIITAEREEASNNKFTDDLIMKVINNSPVEIPNVLVEEGIGRQLQHAESNAQNYGLTLEQLLQYNGVESIEVYKQTIRPNVETDVKKRVIFLKIAEVEKIKITSKEYKEELEIIANEMKASLEEVTKNYSKESLTPYIQMQKVLKLIKDSAVVK